MITKNSMRAMLAHGFGEWHVIVPGKREFAADISEALDILADCDQIKNKDIFKRLWKLYDYL
jgi:hypothetical protein